MARHNAAEDHQEPATGRQERLEGIAGYLADPRARDFDRLVYERVRLGILSALAVNKSLTFTDLKDLPVKLSPVRRVYLYNLAYFGAEYSLNKQQRSCNG